MKHIGEADRQLAFSANMIRMERKDRLQMKLSGPFLFLLCSFLILLLALVPVAPTENPALSWNLRVTVEKKKKTEILHHAFGQMKPGSLHAIIGSSGSGKTTLLNVLAGVKTKGLKVYGDVQSSFETNPIYVQQEDLLFPQLTVQETLETASKLRSSNSDPKAVADRLIMDLGLKKVVSTRVGDVKTRGISGGEKKRLAIANEIAMTSSTTTSSPSLSDGQDEKPRLIFLDEPTSGLDSFQAQNVVQLLKQLTSEGNSVMISIHQPRASIVSMFDELTLLSEGQLIYTGAAGAVASFFKSQGYSVPANTNSIEYFIDLLSVDYSSTDTEEASRDRIQKLATAFKTSQYVAGYGDTIQIPPSMGENDLKKKRQKKMKKGRGDKRRIDISSIEIADEDTFAEEDEYRYSSSGGSMSLTNKRGRPVGKIIKGIRKFRVLFIRAWRQVMRDSKLNFARLMSSLFVSLLYGAIYNKLSLKASSIPDRLGLLQIAAVSTAMTTVVKATTTFVAERQIVNKERKSGAYNTISYLLSKLCAELPLAILFPCISGSIMYKMCGLNPYKGKFANFLKILTIESIAAASIGMAVGSFAPSTEAAVAIAPSIMVIFIVFGGLFVVNTPQWCSWMPNASLIKWGYEALCVNEFTGLTLEPTGPIGTSAISKGDVLLENIGFEKSSVQKCLRGLSGIIATCYAFTYLSLLRQKPSDELLWSRSGAEAEGGNEDETNAADTHTTITALANAISDADADTDADTSVMNAIEDDNNNNNDNNVKNDNDRILKSSTKRNVQLSVVPTRIRTSKM